MDTDRVVTLKENPMEYEHIVHSFEPVYDRASEILILGTLPSVKSRETILLWAQTEPFLESACNTFKGAGSAYN